MNDRIFRVDFIRLPNFFVCAMICSFSVVVVAILMIIISFGDFGLLLSFFPCLINYAAKHWNFHVFVFCKYLWNYVDFDVIFINHERILMKLQKFFSMPWMNCDIERLKEVFDGQITKYRSANVC